MLRQLDALRGRVKELAPLGRANLAWAVAKLQVGEPELWPSVNVATELI